ncbi:MOSC domain-containing protein [Lamprobacter modestohalophilus]|nr:MOSC domain-containing protein [Lamprobacter modestohalophilus]MEA1052907.1 MOSC domain-containing protein [Lamprobacter modestohalophilus]
MTFSKNSPLASLMQTFPRPGRLDWIGLRPAKRAALIHVEAAQAITGAGLEGDHYSGRTGHCGITLLQTEHLPVIAALTGVEEIAPATLRRNLLVSGINLAALSDRRGGAGGHQLCASLLTHGEGLGSRRLQCHARSWRTLRAGDSGWAGTRR